MIAAFAAIAGLVAGVWIGWFGHCAYAAKIALDREVAAMQWRRTSIREYGDQLTAEVERGFEAAGRQANEI